MGRSLEFKELLSKKDYGEITRHAKAISGKTKMLHSSQKAALNDALKMPADVERFCDGLYDLT